MGGAISNDPPKLSGGCRCGKVRYKLEVFPRLKAQCHCRTCQIVSGGKGNLYIIIDSDGFRYTKGVPRAFSPEDWRATQQYHWHRAGARNPSHRPQVRQGTDVNGQPVAGRRQKPVCALAQSWGLQ